MEIFIRIKITESFRPREGCELNPLEILELTTMIISFRPREGRELNRVGRSDV